MVGTVTKDIKGRKFCAVSFSYYFETFFLFFSNLQVKLITSETMCDYYL